MIKYLLILFLLPILCFAKPTTVIYNITSDQVIDGSLNSTEVRVASITKLLTIYTVLVSNQDLDEKLTVTSKKLVNTKLTQGMKLTRKELINMALISSDNVAAVTLGENYPGGSSYFVQQMNFHAKELGMTNSGFVEPTGLSAMNFSTISDIVHLTKAVSEFDIVQLAAQSNKLITNPDVPSSKKKQKPTKVSKQNSIVNNPTSVFFGREGLMAIKTGFTNAAGFCITMLVRANGKLYNIVVLGAKTKQERQQLVEKSLKLIYNT